MMSGIAVGRLDSYTLVKVDVAVSPAEVHDGRAKLHGGATGKTCALYNEEDKDDNVKNGRVRRWDARNEKEENNGSMMRGQTSSTGDSRSKNRYGCTAQLDSRGSRQSRHTYPPPREE